MLAENFFQAIDELCKLKEVKKEFLYEAVQAGLITAYKRNFNNADNASVVIDEANKDISLIVKKNYGTSIWLRILEIIVSDVISSASAS